MAQRSAALLAAKVALQQRSAAPIHRSMITADGKKPMSGQDHKRDNMAGERVARSGGMTREHVASLLGETLEQHFTSVSAGHEQDADAARFRSRRKPEITIRKYMERICRYTGVSAEGMILSVLYLVRFREFNPNIPIGATNIHRLTLLAVVCAAKFTDDDIVNNERFAKVGGIPLVELNSLEVAFCRLMRFEFHVTSEQYRKIASQLVCSNPLLPQIHSNRGPAISLPSIDHICTHPFPSTFGDIFNPKPEEPPQKDHTAAPMDIITPVPHSKYVFVSQHTRPIIALKA